MELDADEPRKFPGPPDRIFGPADMGGGGVGRKILVGEGEGKSEDSLWRRDLSALGPFGAEANYPLCNLPFGDTQGCGKKPSPCFRARLCL